jgi:4-alpha-glucanotransferase
MVEYVDAGGARRQVGDGTLEAVLAAMGVNGELRRSPSGAGASPAAGAGRPLTCQPQPPDRGWGWQVQLYAARSSRSWGMGDAADLRRLGRWAHGRGASVLALNPLSAPLPLLPQEASPYYPSSREFTSPLYVAVEEAIGGASSAEVRTAARALNRERLIDRDAVHNLKLAALEAAWGEFRGDPLFDAFRADGGEALRRFATFNTLCERFGGGWQAWPRRFRHPGSAAVAAVAAELPDRVGFHAWLQWVLQTQLDRAAGEISLVHDLPVGFDPRGADAWAHQDLLAPGISIGAPPDGFNREGQDWGLPAFHPQRLRDAGFAPLAAALRAGMRHGGVHIDHVLGFFRSWWVPTGLPPSQGAYVLQPVDEILDLVAIESRRARALVVGEDLGTVAPGVRAELRRRGILSSRVLWFESRPPRQWPARAAASLSTHDLPTAAGLWNGADLEDELAAGHPTNPQGTAAMRRRLQAASHLGPEAPVEAVIVAAHAAIGASRCVLALASLEDACAATRRPNMPGTTASRSNWRIPLPLRVERLATASLPGEIATALSAARPAAPVTGARRREGPAPKMPKAGQWPSGNRET